MLSPGPLSSVLLFLASCWCCCCWCRVVRNLLSQALFEQLQLVQFLLYRSSCSPQFVQALKSNTLIHPGAGSCSEGIGLPERRRQNFSLFRQNF